MLLTSNRYSIITVLNSVTNTINDDKFDARVPFSFLEFLNYSKALDNHLINLSDYQDYLKKWNGVTNNTQNDLPTQVREQFIVFLKTVALNYTTSEEKRYLSNIDYSSNDDLEIATPFFVNKVKQVILYFADKRDTFKQTLAIAANKGTNHGTEEFIRAFIIDNFIGNESSTQFTTTDSTSAITSKLHIEIEEGYDINNDYFDLDPYEAPAFYNAENDRSAYFSSNTNSIDPEIFLNGDQAIINLINYEQVILDSIPTLAVLINTPDLTLLENSDFIDYSNHTRSNIKLLLTAKLIQKFVGTDFYYLSTNTFGETLSGRLFEATSPYANLLNLHYPSTLTVPASATLYDRDVGLFYRPSIQNIYSLQTPFSYSLKSSLCANSVYVFPDPSKYGNVSGVSKTTFNSPFLYEQHGEDIQRNISSNNAYGHSFVTNNNTTFESYNSREQNKFKSVANKLYNSGIATTNVSDPFGNVIVGFKQQNTLFINNWTNNVSLSSWGLGLSALNTIPYTSNIKTANTLPFLNTSTAPSNIQGLATPLSIYDERETNGDFYVFNALSSQFTSLTAAFSDVLTKYPTESNYIRYALHNVEIYDSTYVFTTFAYKLIDRIDFDGQFKKSPSVPLSLHVYSNHLASNVFNVSKTLNVATYTLVDNVSAQYNNRQFTLSFYQYDTRLNTWKQLTFLSSNVFQYAVNSKLDANNLKLSYNSRQDVYNIIVDLKDLNRNIFIHNLVLKIANGRVEITKDILYACTNNNCTINFYDGSNSIQNVNILSNALSSIPYISTSNGTYQF
jgi:hypothetical protein